MSPLTLCLAASVCFDSFEPPLALGRARYRTRVVRSGSPARNRLALRPDDRHDACMSNPPVAEVPPPSLVASWEWLGLLPTALVPLWAAHWLVVGYDGEALVYLAGLHGDDPRDVHDALPEALRDCGVKMPDSDVLAAKVVFTHDARLYLDGRVGAEWLLDRVDRIAARSGYLTSVLDLPLGGLFGVDDEWGAGWGRSKEELLQVVREACEEQISTGPVT